jgi:hypothetical protein
MGTSFYSDLFQKLYEGILGIDIFFWLLGTIGQRLANRNAAQKQKDDNEDGYIVGNLPWTYLLGVRPTTEKVYITPALVLQVPALMHLLFGGLALWLDNSDVYEVITAVCWLLMPWLGVIGSVVTGLRRESTKAADEGTEIARNENATSKTETTNDKELVGAQEEEDKEEEEANQEELPQGSRKRRGRHRKG